MVSAVRVAARLDKATEGHRLLEHPFYKAWADGTLTIEDLKHYATQYWRQVEAFPGYLSSIGNRIDPPAADIVKANLSDELDGDHASLWLQFAGAMGADEEVVRHSPIEPETKACVNSFAEATASASPAFALGMLYGYESQTPMVAKTKVDGLRTHYGIEGPGLEYFELHGELDVEHASEMAGAIAQLATDEVSLEEAAAGARAGAQAVWGLLDGVCRVRGI